MTVKKEGAIHRFVGLSTDTKPSGSTVAIGSTFYEYDTNDTYLTPDNTNWYVKDSKSVKKFKVTTTLSASVAYTANDVLSNTGTASSAVPWTFNAVAGYNGGTGKIVQIQAETTANICSADLRLYLFNASPTCNLADNLANEAPKATDVSTGIYLGFIDFPKLLAQGTSGNAIAQINSTGSTMPFYFSTPSTADDLYGIVTTATAATFASKELAITLWVKRL